MTTWSPPTRWGRVRITFAVDAAGLGVNTIGLLFAGIYAEDVPNIVEVR